MYDYLIVGAGLTGATVANRLNAAGKDVLVIDRREHVAGNCYDELVDGIRVHRYGGHIFHTNSTRIWNYVNLFTDWQQYEHRVKAYVHGAYYPFPPNRMTAQQMFSERVPEDICINLFYKPFSEKAWGRPWEEIPNEIRSRVQMRDTWDDRYFTDIYQGLPVNGYTQMVQGMLQGVVVELHTDFCQDRDYWLSKARTVVYTGALDELMEYQHGMLEYRSLRFETEILETPDYQGCPTVNYPEKETPYTVINEWKHYGWGKYGYHTVITRQYPASCEETGERFYPFVDQANRMRHQEYVEALDPRIIPAGRLGRFQYLNMDQAVGAALKLADRLLTTESVLEAAC